jgi:uncharacterized membrane protein
MRQLISERLQSVEALRIRLAQSLFFLPFMMVLASLVLSQVTVQIDRRIAPDVLPEWFQATVPSSRAILSAIAGGTITAASIVFSLTLVAVQLAASQFSPRVLRGFLGDRFQQLVVGTVVGTFSYSLLVLREVRAADEGGSNAFLPQVSIAVALLFAILALTAVLASIDHTAKGLRVGSVADDIMNSTIGVIERLFDPRSDESDSALVFDAPGVSPAPQLATTHVADRRPPGHATMILSPRTGWVTAIDTAGALEALPDGTTLMITAAVGTFVAEGTPVAHWWPDDDSDHGSDSDRRDASSGSSNGRDEGGHNAESGEVEKIVRRTIQIEAARTMQQDVAFGLLQLNDIALRALSPGVNDPNTASEVVVRIGAILTELFRRDLAPVTNADGTRRLVRPTEPTFDDYVDLAIEPIRRYARTEPDVSTVLIRTLAAVIEDSERRFADPRTQPLVRQLEAVREELERFETAADRARVRAVLDEHLAP